MHVEGGEREGGRRPEHNLGGEAGHSLGTAHLPSAFMHKLSLLFELHLQFCVCMGYKE